MRLRHDSRQIMLNMYLCSRYFLSVLNMGSKHYSRQVMKFVYWRLKKKPTCTEYGIQQDMPLKMIVHWRLMKLTSNHKLRPLKEFVFWVSRISLSVWNMGFKYDVIQVMNFVCWNFSCSQPMLKMGFKHYLLHLMIIVYWTCDYPC